MIIIWQTFLIMWPIIFSILLLLFKVINNNVYLVFLYWSPFLHKCYLCWPNLSFWIILVWRKCTTIYNFKICCFLRCTSLLFLFLNKKTFIHILNRPFQIIFGLFLFDEIFWKNFFRLHLLGSDVFFWKETSRKEHKRPIINQKNLHEYVKKIIIIISTNRSLCIIIISLKLYSILLFSIFNLHCVVALNRKSTKRETNENKYLIKISYIYIVVSLFVCYKF